MESGVRWEKRNEKRSQEERKKKEKRNGRIQ